MRDRLTKAWIVLIIVAAACASAFASRRNSLTWDEPVMIASGARGVRTGDFGMTWDQPPGIPFFYGVAIRTYDIALKARGQAGVRFPSEDGTIVLPPELTAQLPPSIHATGPVPKWGLYDRYDYAREFFFKSGNDPESLAFAARLATILLASLLGLAVAAFAWRTAGPAAALIGVSLFVFLPDELAQSGIAYNDVALALCFFVASWAIDACIRKPTPRSAVIAGGAAGLALGVKFSALTLGPVAVFLCAAEWISRRSAAAWRKRMPAATFIALGVGAVVLFVVYGGDLTLTQFREGVGEQLRHSSAGHGVPAYLFGHTSDNGMWYFFPVALVLKTPVAFHVLAIIAVIGYVVSRKKNDTSALASPLRFLIVGTVVYLAVLMRSNLDIGVRYALAVMPAIVLLVAVGLARLWDRAGVMGRSAIAALVVASVASPLPRYPWFLSYVTEWVPLQASRTAMVDSNVDWGQGLLALRDFMRDERVDGVYLAYFGSALPEGYGIRYSPLPSWSPLPTQPALPTAPHWAVISVTLLEGLYENGDPFHTLRARPPDRIIANSLFAYRVP